MALDTRFPAGMTHFLLQLLIKFSNSDFKSVIHFYLALITRPHVDFLNINCRCHNYYPNIFINSLIPSIKTSISSLVLYMAKEALAVAGTP